MDEADIQARWLLNAGALPGVRLFRNQVGKGWMGQVVKQEGTTVLLKNARFVSFGLATGSSDLIGWDHGRFLAVELKTPTGRASPEQLNFIAQVTKAGGTARIVRDPNDFDWLVS